MPEGSGLPPPSPPRAHSRRREVDPYEVLQISPHASAEVIKAAYRVLALGAHPDVNRHRDSTSLMREINAAYQMLSDPGRRAEYDARTRPVRSQRARRLQAAERTAWTAPRNEVGRERVYSAPIEPSSGLARVRGRAVAVLAVLASAVLMLLMAAWAINDLADDHPDSAFFATGRFSVQTAPDHRAPMQLFTHIDTSVDQP